MALRANALLSHLGRGRAFSHRAEQPLRDAIIPTFYPDYRHKDSPALPGFRFDGPTLAEIKRYLDLGGEDAVEPLRKRAAERAAERERAAAATPNNNKPSKAANREASVLMLLCEVEDTPSVLYTVRSPGLRRHTGEISFPGGIRDPSDESTAHAALRETKEEIGIDAEHIQILGALPWLPDLTGRIRVFPYLGFVDLKKLGISRPSQIKGNPGEVARCFHLTVPQLFDPLRKRDMTFRGTKIHYWGFRADDVDLLPPLPQSVIDTGDLRALSDYERIHGNTVVWGLTGFVTSEVIRKALGPVLEDWKRKQSST